MSYAPRVLLDLREYALDALDAPAAGVGIVGDAAHRGGYHLGLDRLVKARGWSDYSATRPRDRVALRGPTADAAAAFDLSARSRRHREWLAALVRDLLAGAEYTRDIRAVNGSLNGRDAWRWDREAGFRPASDRLGHVSHSHVEWYRDAIAAGRSQLAVLVRPLQVRRSVRRKAPGDKPMSIKTLPGGRRPWWQLVAMFYTDVPTEPAALRTLGEELRAANRDRPGEGATGDGSARWETVGGGITLTVPPTLHY